MKIEELKYVSYFRKSSDNEDRQVLSIDSQKDEMRRIENVYKLNVVRIIEETKSAKSQGRAGFDEMMKLIEKGEVDAILCWKLDRLARNMADGGKIIDWLQTGKIKEIRCFERSYYPTDNVILIAVEFGQANQYVKDLSLTVKRGLRTKASGGYPSGVSIVGYINDMTNEKGNRNWKVDEIRFPIVKKMFNLYLTGHYSISQIYYIARDELKLTTPKRKRSGGNPISKSYVYTMFKNPIYAGFFEVQGKRYELNLNLPRIITEEQYWQIQAMLGSKGIKRIVKRETTYGAVAKCGLCNGALFPDFKFQVICSVCKKKFSSLNKDSCVSCGTKIADMIKPTYLSYIYYNCINDKKHRTTCLNNGIEEKKLQEALITNLKEDVSISKELSEWCIDNIHRLKDSDLEEQLAMKNNLEQQELGLKSKLKKIAIARVSREMTNDEEQTYSEIESDTRKKLEQLSTQKNNMNVDWFSEASKDFSLMAEVVNIIENGTVEQKKNILLAFGSNLSIKDKKVIVSNKKSIETFSKFLKLARAQNEAFEPRNNLATKEKTEPFDSVIPTLLRD